MHTVGCDTDSELSSRRAGLISATSQAKSINIATRERTISIMGTSAYSEQVRPAGRPTGTGNLSLHISPGLHRNGVPRYVGTWHNCLRLDACYNPGRNFNLVALKSLWVRSCISHPQPAACALGDRWRTALAKAMLASRVA
jgi:hypothetical protein